MFDDLGDNGMRLTRGGCWALLASVIAGCLFWSIGLAAVWAVTLVIMRMIK